MTYFHYNLYPWRVNVSHRCWKFGVIFILFYFILNTFIQQGLIKLIKHDIKDIYNVTKKIYFKP